jgi:poly-beta-hydroxybutyrate-responsive repressor
MNGEGGQPLEPRLHGEMLSTTLLAMLRNWNAYGYQLAQEMSKAGLPAFDFGTIYRTLRQLERSGLVSSFWDTSPSGPARRMYSLTQTGDAFLSSWIDMLQRYQSVLQSAAEAYKNSDPGLRADGEAPAEAEHTREAEHG